jgi:hypothetical protein
MLYGEITLVSTSQYQTINIGQLQESPTNPRKTFSEEVLRELADSIKALAGWSSPSLCVQSTLIDTKWWPEPDGSGPLS